MWKYWRVALFAMLGMASLSSAQSFPVKPVRFIVGPGPDILARLIGQKLTERWGQQVVVDQRAGAGGVIALEATAKALPDGYTLLQSTGSFIVNTSLNPTAKYDLARDVAPVSQLALIPFLLVVHPGVNAKSVEELVRLARAKPGELNFVSGGTGTAGHLAGEMFKSMAAIDIVHVPYKALAAAITDVLGGQAQIMFAAAQIGLSHVRAGRLRALALSSARRSVIVPDLPTVAESGYPGFEFVSWSGVHTTAGTPAPLIADIGKALAQTLAQQELRERMRDLGMEPVVSAPAEFAAFVKADIARTAKVLKDSGVRIE
jgi:tripartite-type tricarboxylate transporter receptor subunit TctC